MIRVSPVWLGLREAADASARSTELATLASARARGGIVIHDLGCGTGSMARWLAPRLAGAQHWVLHDRDPGLLTLAAKDMPERAADGAPVTVETRLGDLADLTADDLRGADLVTASALLDLLTADEVERIAAACAGCPTLLTLSVTGEVELTPADPLDARIAAAFNVHQRRMTGGRSLLGPDASEAAIGAFHRHGTTTLVRPSPWRLGRFDVDLMGEWLAGWLNAACEQEPELAGAVEAYARRRRVEAAQGRLTIVVHHRDVLARRV